MVSTTGVKVIDLTHAPGRPPRLRDSKWRSYAWPLVEMALVTNRLQISSRVRVAALRAFGATIGDEVVFRPRTRVKSPWRLRIGDRSWIGEGVWFDNHDHVSVGADVVLSQETYLTTGSHAVRTDMGLVTSPVTIDDGAWITSRCVVLGGAHVGRSAVVAPLTVVKGEVPANAVLASAEPRIVGERFGSAQSARSEPARSGPSAPASS